MVENKGGKESSWREEREARLEGRQTGGHFNIPICLLMCIVFYLLSSASEQQTNARTTPGSVRGYAECARAFHSMQAKAVAV